jgi:hypothetical protein
MIRIGHPRNILRAPSSLSETWPRFAYHHLGQRHSSSRTQRPDKSPHSITCPRPRNSLQTRAASTRECWIPVPLPPPAPLSSNFSERRFCLFSPADCGPFGSGEEPRSVKSRPSVLSSGPYSLNLRTAAIRFEIEAPENPLGVAGYRLRDFQFLSPGRRKRFGLIRPVV